MASVIRGIVREGVVIPASPLPEGAQVEIRQVEPRMDVPAELQAELDAWQQAGAEALELVERLAEEDSTHDAR
jgi:hypothetical protein